MWSESTSKVVFTVTVYLRRPVDFGVFMMIIYDTAAVNLPSPASLKVPKLWVYFWDGMKCLLQVRAYSWGLSFTLSTECLGKTQYVPVQVLWIYIAGSFSILQKSKLQKYGVSGRAFLYNTVWSPLCLVQHQWINIYIHDTFKLDLCITNVGKITSHNKWWYNCKQIL